MSETAFRDVIARIAIDPEFARQVRENPEEVAARFGLSTEEAADLCSLGGSEPPAGPSRLGNGLAGSPLLHGEAEPAAG